MHPLAIRLEDLSRSVYLKCLEYRAVHMNSIPQMIRHILFGMVLCNIFLFFATLDRASILHHDHKESTSDTSLFLSAISFVHVIGVWYFLFHSLEPMYIGGGGPSYHSSLSASSSSSSGGTTTYDYILRHQGLICNRNDLTIGITVGITVALGVFLFHITLSLEHVLDIGGPIRLYAFFLACMDFVLAIFIIKGKEDFIQIQHVWESHQYHTISDPVLVDDDEEENRTVMDTILGYHHK